MGVAVVVLTAIALVADALGLPDEWIIVILGVAFAAYVAIREVVERRLRGDEAKPIYLCNGCRRRFGESAFSGLHLRPIWKCPLWLEVVVGMVLLPMTVAWWFWAESLREHLILMAGFVLVVLLAWWVKSLQTKDEA